MPRLKDGRNSLLIAHNNSLPSDEDLLLLLDENSSENPHSSTTKSTKDLTSMTFNLLLTLNL